MLMHLYSLVRSGLGIPDWWHPNFEMQGDFATGKIGRYPLSVDIKADYPGPVNDEGVPLLYSNKVANSKTSPVTIALYGLGSHDVFIATQNERYRRQLFCVLRWLENHRVPLGEGIGWPHEVNVPLYGLQAPWFSCLTQGYALSLFVRAYLLERDKKWEDLAFQTWLGFHVSVAKGGFSRDVHDNGIIYEEYPCRQLDCTFNGMCIALIGLWEAWRSGLVKEAETDFSRGITSLRSYLPRFDHKGWSLYSLSNCLGREFLASPHYLQVNGILATIVSIMGNEPEFNVYGQRWLSTNKSFLRRIRMSLRVLLDRAPTASRFRPKAKTNR